MSCTETQIQAALKEVVDPNTGRDLVAGRSIRNIKLAGEEVSLDVELGYPARSQIELIRGLVTARLNALGIAAVHANVYQKSVAHEDHAATTVVALVPRVTVLLCVPLHAALLALPPHPQMEATNPLKHSVLKSKKLPLSASAR